MSNNTIVVSGDPVRREYKADAAITPGHLLERTSTGVKVHATAGGRAAAIFALEDDLQGNGITTAYTIANRVQTGHFKSGDQAYALLANGESASVGDWLESAGSGELRVVDADASVGLVVTGSVIAFAEEAVDMSDSSAADPATARITVTVR